LTDAPDAQLLGAYLGLWGVFTLFMFFGTLKAARALQFVFLSLKSRPLLIVLLLVMGGVSVWTPLTHDDIAERWFTLPNLYYFLPV
ncbi:hypothetical protein MJI37_31680, partial [Salmonella enterica subsp. enterica serovar Cerro]|nr:hypothetical protein [Salmonella enterica subsp. enterica serovar Cerro]